MVSQINKDHLKQMVREFGAVGRLSPRSTTVTRLAYYKSDLAVRRVFADHARRLGLDVVADRVGNILAIPPDLSKDDQIILCGSHLDTVAYGGMYDGAVGIICALEALRSLQRDGADSQKRVGIINFACEEAARFRASTLGSRFFTGQLSDAQLANINDVDNERLTARDVVQSVDFQALIEGPQRRLFTPVGAAGLQGQVAAFIELHIEQGPVLEQNGIPIGIVTHVAAPTRLEIRLHGTGGHSGTTPMLTRSDSVLGALRIWDRFDEHCKNEQSRDLVWTAIGVHTPHAQWGKIPDEVILEVELRGTTRRSKERAVQELRRITKKVCIGPGLKFRLKICYDGKPERLSVIVAERLRSAAKRCGLEYREMESRAGHDAMNMQRVTEAGMIFIPCKGGISHSGREFARIDDIENGVRVLAAAISETDQRLRANDQRYRQFDLERLRLQTPVVSVNPATRTGIHGCPSTISN